MTDTLAERIAKRLAETKKSARRVSLEAGLGPDAIRTILSGRSKSPRAENLNALARSLGCDVRYLLGETDDPGFYMAPDDDSGRAQSTIRVLGVTSHGVWAEPNRPFRGGGALFVPPISDYDADRQYAVIIGDYALEEILPHKSFVHLIYPDDADSELTDGMVVEAVRLRDGGTLCERSLWQIEQLENGRRSLRTRYADRAMDELIPIDSIERDGQAFVFKAGGETIRFLGWAARAYVYLAGAPLFEPDDERPGWRRYLSWSVTRP